MSLVLPQCLLVLSLLFVRPAADRAWPRRLALHALVLSACLFAAALTPGPDGSPGTGLRLLGLTAVLIQFALVQLVFARAGVAEEPVPDAHDRPAGSGWLPPALLLMGLVLVALAIRIIPSAVLPRGVLAICAGMVLIGMLGALAARGSVGRIGSLLLAGDALVLAACRLPGMDLLSFATIFVFQAGLLVGFFRAFATPDGATETSS